MQSPPRIRDTSGQDQILARPTGLRRPEHHGLFLAVETKGTRTGVQGNQTDFLAMVHAFGGLGGIARTKDAALALLEAA